jgi:hypothetical protein
VALLLVLERLAMHIYAHAAAAAAAAVAAAVAAVVLLLLLLLLLCRARLVSWRCTAWGTAWAACCTCSSTQDMQSRYAGKTATAAAELVPGVWLRSLLVYAH